MQPVLRLEGQRFGRLLVISQAKTRRSVSGKVITFWLCRCDCGTEKEIAMRPLRQERTLSCGCLWREMRYLNRTTHGLSHMPEYAIWKQMIHRCTNPKNINYANYGGRGIKVCERWITFLNFLADVSPRPAGKSLDRINNDGDYEPGNVRWATPVEQRRNQQRYKAKHPDYAGQIVAA
jgi:hypothetical protein